MADKRIDEPTGTETVGHEWDGIEELDTPMPRWWLWTLYATIIWGIGYTVLYPAWPMIEKATEGTLGWSSREQLAAEMAAEADRKAPITLALAQIPIERLPEDSQLLRTAIEGGRAAFNVNCTTCHGTGAAGSKGYPNLNDDDWLWGGDLTAIHTTLKHGIREQGTEGTRFSQMPAFGRDGILTNVEINDVASFVLTLSGDEADRASAARGSALYATNCAVCHGPAGEGDRTIGAPKLNDAIWLFGGTRSDIVQSIANSRYGVMPSWEKRLDPVTVKMLAAYVHSLGGGEELVVETDTDEADEQAGEVPVAVEQNARP